MSQVHGPGLGVCQDDGGDRSISSPLARRAEDQSATAKPVRGGAIPAARSVRVPARLGGAALGPARQAGGAMQTTPFSLAQRASVGSTEAPSSDARGSTPSCTLVTLDS